MDVWKGDAGTGWACRNATSPTIRYRTTISTPIDIDMSLPQSIAGLSKGRKHLSAESGDKGVGLGGIDPANLDGPQPAPAYRDRSQGQKFDDTKDIILVDVLTLLLQTRYNRIRGRLHPPRPGQPSAG